MTIILAPRDAYYFGCVGECGHRLWDSLLRRRPWFEARDGLPWGNRIDGGLCSIRTRTPGIARLHHTDGWTALALWDHSIDKRPGSNSVFVFRGTLTFD